MKKIGKMFGYLKTMRYLCNAFEKQICSSASAQMAELVDALVSNTNGFTSIPVRPRVWVQVNPDNRLIIRVFSFCKAY